MIRPERIELPVSMTLNSAFWSPSRLLLLLLLAWLSGLAIRACLNGHYAWSSHVLVLLIGLTTAVVLAKIDRRIIWCVVLLTVLVGGFWRYDWYWRQSNFVRSIVDLPKSVGQFEGIIISEPRERVDGLVEFEIEVQLLNSATISTSKARLYIKSPLHYSLGDRLNWSCKPRLIDPNNATGFDRRLLLDGVQWTCNVYKPLKVLENIKPNILIRSLTVLRQSTIKVVERVLPEPEASFLLGLLIGRRDGLPKDLVDAFRQAGLSHILAVSGYNVSQLISVGIILFGLTLLPRRKSSTVMVVGVVVFAALVGGDASVVRAAVMGCVGLLAVLYQRRYDATRSILLAASLMLLQNPLALRYDVGWQLSFAAVWGLHGLAPRLLELLADRWQRNFFIKLIVETSAATITTLPIILHVFGRLPVVTLLANVLILPFLPWVMLFGSLAAIVGIVSVNFAVVPAVIAAWLLRVIEWLAVQVVRWVPQALELNLGSVTMIILYVWLGLLVGALGYRSKILCQKGS